MTVLLLLPTGCGGVVRKRTTIDVPEGYYLAQQATLEELVDLINRRYAGTESLTVSSLHIEFEGGSVDQGYFERYPRARGYLVATWPDSIFVNILNPLTNSTVVTMAAREKDFQIWVPRENKYLIGKTDVEVEEENPVFNVRPQHLLPAILMDRLPVDESGYHYFLEEEEDGRFKYYVLGILREEGKSGRLRLVRRIWVERSRLQVVRQQYYDETGAVVSRIQYRAPLEIGEALVSSGIDLERARERYSMRLEFAAEGIQVNRSIREEAFEVPRPAGAEVVLVRGKADEGTN